MRGAMGVFLALFGAATWHWPAVAAGLETSKDTRRPLRSAQLASVERLPLQTSGRYIVDTRGDRVKWACVNWAGAYFKTHVVGGLEVQPLRNLTRRISELGFNCVRLCYSTQGYITNPLIDHVDLAANPQLMGRRFLDVFDETVKALTDEGLMVIVNNHNSKSGWCCTIDQDEGLWYVPEYSEAQWIESLVGFAARYRDNKLVVGYDLRNEPHDVPGTHLTWGDGNPESDWAAAATRAGNAVLAVNPDAIIVVSALCFCMDLRPIREHPIVLNISNRVVYEVHNYIEFQFHTLVTNNVASWVTIEQICLLMVLFFSCCLSSQIITLRRMERPLPSRPAMCASICGWCACIFFVLALLGLGFFLFYLKMCSYYAKSFVFDYFVLALCLFLVFVFCTVGVCVVHRQTKEEDDEDEGVSNSDEDEDSIAVDNALADTSARSLVPKTRQPTARRRFLMFQTLMLNCVVILVFLSIMIFSAVGDSYMLQQMVFDFKWGFALEEGYPYTAPVWMGEFGQYARGRYWMNFIKYLSVRDIDWAYWPLNGKKLSEGYFTETGQWIDYEKPLWEDETFGILQQDYATVRENWKILDLQAVMPSPASWTTDAYPCDRSVIGNACGG